MPSAIQGPKTLVRLTYGPEHVSRAQNGEEKLERLFKYSRQWRGLDAYLEESVFKRGISLHAQFASTKT